MYCIQRSRLASINILGSFPRVELPLKHLHSVESIFDSFEPNYHNKKLDHQLQYQLWLQSSKNTEARLLQKSEIMLKVIIYDLI